MVDGFLIMVGTVGTGGTSCESTRGFINPNDVDAANPRWLLPRELLLSDKACILLPFDLCDKLLGMLRCEFLSAKLGLLPRTLLFLVSNDSLGFNEVVVIFFIMAVSE